MQKKWERLLSMGKGWETRKGTVISDKKQKMIIKREQDKG